LYLNSKFLPVNTSLSGIYPQNSFKSEHQNRFEKQAFLKGKSKRFPIFGIVSLVSFALAFLSIKVAGTEHNWPIVLLLVLLLVSLISSIEGLAIGEFWVWSALGLLLNLLALAFLYLITHAGKQC
jgi:hypothetical protein